MHVAMRCEERLLASVQLVNVTRLGGVAGLPTGWRPINASAALLVGLVALHSRSP